MTSTDSLRDAIAARVAATPGATVAVSYRDLQTGESIDINSDSVFHAASTMKIPVMIEVLRRSQLGAFGLDQPVLLVNQFASLADGSPFSLNAADDGDTTLYGKVGERVTVRELLRRMITRSSNLATNELIELVSAQAVTEGAHKLCDSHIGVARRRRSKGVRQGIDQHHDVGGSGDSSRRDREWNCSLAVELGGNA